MRNSLDGLSEDVDKQELISALKEKSRDDPETFEMLQSWLGTKEAKVDQAGRTDDTVIAFELERAELYFLSGYTDFAAEVFDDAETFAEQTGRLDLRDKVIAERTRMFRD